MTAICAPFLWTGGGPLTTQKEDDHHVLPRRSHCQFFLADSLWSPRLTGSGFTAACLSSGPLLPLPPGCIGLSSDHGPTVTSAHPVCIGLCPGNGHCLNSARPRTYNPLYGQWACFLFLPSVVMYLGGGPSVTSAHSKCITLC